MLSFRNKNILNQVLRYTRLMKLNMDVFIENELAKLNLVTCVPKFNFGYTHVFKNYQDW